MPVDRNDPFEGVRFAEPAPTGEDDDPVGRGDGALRDQFRHPGEAGTGGGFAIQPFDGGELALRDEGLGVGDADGDAAGCAQGGEGIDRIWGDAVLQLRLQGWRLFGDAEGVEVFHGVEVAREGDLEGVVHIRLHRDESWQASAEVVECAEGVQLLNAIQDVYLDPAITVA